MGAFGYPDHEPWRAFARFTFLGADGLDHEIDLLVSGPTGCFLIEFEALRTFDHPGVLRVYDLDECDLGFVITFERTKNFVRLDHFMLARGARLDFSARLGLLRLLCEAVSAAHDRGIAHRGLVPSVILIANPDAERPTIKLRNWHRRMLADAANGAMLQTFGGETISDLRSAADELSELEKTYLAPELRVLGEPGGITADICALGALAYLIFTGRAPAQTLEQLDSILVRQQHLAVSQQLHGASAGLERFIARSAHASPFQRAATARELIEWLDKTQDELARPESATLAGPDDLVKDVVLEGGSGGEIRVVRRLGSGGTAIGFEVTREGASFALKVARTPELNGRLAAECKTLEALRKGKITDRSHKSIPSNRQSPTSRSRETWSQDPQGRDFAKSARVHDRFVAEVDVAKGRIEVSISGKCRKHRD